jgi:hypothetical protein
MSSSRFIKGPIPLIWLANANRLGGSVGVVAFVLWFYDGMNAGRPFKIDHSLDDITGVSRQTRQSALKKLEQARLIELKINRGAYPTVRIIKPA